VGVGKPDRVAVVGGGPADETAAQKEFAAVQGKVQYLIETLPTTLYEYLARMRGCHD
jgi:hypothetical protein